jgi:DNA-binding XRE family transcriptional regulator
MILTSEMVRAARALLRWGQEDLAREAGVSLATIKRLEKEPGPIRGALATADAIQTVFAAACIEFSFDRGESVTKLKAES